MHVFIVVLFKSVCGNAPSELHLNRESSTCFQKWFNIMHEVAASIPFNFQSPDKWPLLAAEIQASLPCLQTFWRRRQSASFHAPLLFRIDSQGHSFTLWHYSQDTMTAAEQWYSQIVNEALALGSGPVNSACATYVFGKHITVKTLITSLLLPLMGLTNFDCLPCVLCFRIWCFWLQHQQYTQHYAQLTTSLT